MKRSHAVTLLYVIGVVVGIVSVLAWRHYQPLGQPSLPKITLREVPGGVLKIEVADEPHELTSGYSRRLPISQGQGMLFLFPEVAPRSFWMKDMRFALDIVFLRDNRVVDVFERVPPPARGQDPVTVRVPEPGADAVLELRAGEAKRRGIGPGTVIPGLPRFR